MVQATRSVLEKGGVASLFRGTHATICRDVVWGGTYAVLRHGLPALLCPDADVDAGEVRVHGASTFQFSCNVVAALVATVVAAPFNFVRNIQYGHLTERRERKMVQTLKQVWREAANHQSGRAMYLVSRMNVGWGTLRVGVSMGVGSQLYAFYMHGREKKI